MKTPSYQNLINRLKKFMFAFDEQGLAVKLECLKGLMKTSLPRGKQLVEFQEVMLFCKSHAQNEQMLKLTNQLLSRMAMQLKETANLKVYDNSGLPHTPITAKFSHDAIRHLLVDKNVSISIDSYEEDAVSLNSILKTTLPPAEREITSAGMNNEDLLSYLHIDEEHQLQFVINEMRKWDNEPITKDYLFDSLGIKVGIHPKNKIVSKAFNQLNTDNYFYHSNLLKKFDHKQLLDTPILEAEVLSPKEHQQLVQTIKYALLVTSRETDPVTYMQESSLRLYELERGISIAIYGITPDRQLSFESYVGYTLFKNGLPAAYGGGWVFGKRALFGINVFEPYRGGESGIIFCQLLRTYKHVFNLDYIEVEPYQYGLDNPEGIESGAFWFYYKFGFRPLDKKLNQLAKDEFNKIKKGDGYRSNVKVLTKFTESNIALAMGKSVPLTVFELSQQITEMIATKFNGNRKVALNKCVDRLLQDVKLARIDFNDDELKVLYDMGLWYAVLSKPNKTKANQLVQLAKLKPIDLYLYQQQLVLFLNNNY